MSTATDPKNTTVPTGTGGNGKDDPVKLCCTAPPDTDPGPIKP
ncbi:MAG: hypothetical protein QOF89_899 [Acidobacteriota bacterium]|jgi:hypothetical protein|nr:hypothetical protein [Acidobacteriota bacterium]